MEWKDLSSLLARAYERLSSQQHTRVVVSEAVNAVLGCHLTEKEVEVRGRVAHVRAHPAIKSELILRKDSLMKALRERGLADRVTEVR